jgi:16S rRNA (guanine1516-N2)-methyltransferase
LKPAALRVTVSSRTNPALAARARAKAREWGLEYVERSKKTGLALLGPGEFLVLGADGWALREGETSLKFTPGMAVVRIKRLAAGVEDDTLLRLAQLAPADRVLDCTFGLGADALVCARAVGPEGRVLGVEASFVLWALATEGLAHGLEIDGLAPIEVQRADHLDVLRALPAKSFEVVLFDPMFTRPQQGSPAFELLRRHANPQPLSAEALSHARRVATRWVLVKGAKYSKDLKALGLTPERGSRSSNRVWARVAPTG